jgi:superfamily II DNA/RNA helicase
MRGDRIVVEIIDTELLYKYYSKPTVIQAVSWPTAMCGRDMISIAKTGSGKTLGFILPGIMHILKQTPRAQNDGPIVVVLLPTRELAQQVEVVSREYCQAMGFKLTCCFGGAAKGPQQIALSRGGLICLIVSV